MAAKNLHQQTVEIRITEMGKTNNKNKQTTQSKIVNKNLCIHLNAITKKTKQTTTKQAVASKNTTTDNVANKQEKQKNTNFVKQKKNQIKTHRKKQEPQAIMYINANTKKYNKQSPNKPLAARTTQRKRQNTTIKKTTKIK